MGAPIFYRDVPLMPSETEKGVIKPLAKNAIPLIAWRLRNVGETSSRRSDDGHPLLRQLPLRLGATARPWAWTSTGRATTRVCTPSSASSRSASIRDENVVAWSTFQGKLGGKLRVGFMSQVSPDGRVCRHHDQRSGPAADATTSAGCNPRDLISNYFVANFKDYRFLQVFYPTRGILAWYSRATGRLQPLPGADDPRYVHTDASRGARTASTWCSRAPKRENAYPAGTRRRRNRANDPNETPIQYDLYRIPFNDGKGRRRRTDRRRFRRTA